MKPQKRQLFFVIGGIFGAGLEHSLLPPGGIWIRVGLTTVAAIVVIGLLAWLLPHSRTA